MFFSSTHDILRVVVIAPLAYIALIILLRVSGKRMLSKMSAFDLVVTIALGSTLATIVLSKEVSLTEGLTALAMLLGLQYAAAWASSRSKAVSRVLKSEPVLLFYDGAFLSAALLREHVPEEAVRAGMRQHGFARIEDVRAVILEADGSLSVLGRTPGRANTVFPEVKGTDTAADGPA